MKTECDKGDSAECFVVTLAKLKPQVGDVVVTIEPWGDADWKVITRERYGCVLQRPGSGLRHFRGWAQRCRLKHNDPDGGVRDESR